MTALLMLVGCQARSSEGNSSIADQAFQLVAPMGGDLGGGVERKAVDAGTACPGERGLLALVAKACANMTDLLASPLPKGDALLHRGRQGPGELGGVIDQRIIACLHHGVETRFEVPEMAELADDSMADLLDDVSDVGVGRGRDCEKAWLASLVGAIQIDPFKEDNMIMQIQIMALPKRWLKVTDPSWMLAHSIPRLTAWLT